MQSERVLFSAISFNGDVYIGKRHHQIGIGMVNDGVCTAPYPCGDAQGFVTNLGRFVSRKEAMQIAISSGQIDKPKRTELFSEDLC